MGLSSFNVSLNLSETVQFGVSHLSAGTFVLNITASDVKDRIFFPHSETSLFMTLEQMQELAQKLNIYLNGQVKEDACDSCQKTKDVCDCVPCRSCGEDTDKEDIYMGYCPSCEDQRMVRSIR